jgi:hypothetical protein
LFFFYFLLFSFCDLVEFGIKKINIYAITSGLVRMETMVVVVVVMVWLLGVVGLLQVLVVLVLSKQLLVRAIAHQLRHTHTSMSG